MSAALDRLAERAPRWLQYLCFVLILALGAALSWQGGLSIDDEYERRTVEANGAAVAAFFDGSDTGFAALNAYGDRYYGIGFHALAAPVRAVVAPLYEREQDLDPRSAAIAANHAAVFVFFLCGAYAFYRLLRLADVRPCFARWAVLFLLANPYLLGHATMNVKDAPFLVAWLLCTWRLAVICAAVSRAQRLRRRDFAWLGLATALLLSIRVSGVLIGVEYAVAAIVLAAWRGSALWSQRSVLPIGALIAGVVMALAVWLAYPVLWRAPWRIVEAVAYMSHHPWGGCTLTWGECLPAQDLPWFYVPAWLAVKLSVVGAIGIVAAILLWRRRDVAAFLSLLALLSAVAVIVVLILGHAHLYNELRQVLFIVPLLYLAAMLGLSRWRRVGTAVVVIGIAVAALDQVSLFPYPYVGVNEIARFARIDAAFETDYWMLSTREASDVLAQSAIAPSTCVYVPYPAQMAPFLRSATPCFGTSLQLPADEPRPFVLFSLANFVGRHYDDLPNCHTVYSVRRRVAFAPRPMELGALRLCL